MSLKIYYVIIPLPHKKKKKKNLIEVNKRINVLFKILWINKIYSTLQKIIVLAWKIS